jgi:hypothetical protein
MTYSTAQLTLICSLFVGQYACSASDPSASGADTRGSGGSSQAGASAAGSGTLSGGSAGVGGASGGSADGQAAGGAGAGGSSGANGTGGASGTMGAAGASASGGSGGATVTCTPGSGSEAIGQSSELDQKTCLTWTKTRTAMTLTNKQAFKYCDDLTQDGISDWRVPRPEELVTWPGLTTDSTAYITGPIYIPNDAASVVDGCTGDSHSCNIAKYNDASVTCGWQGVGFTGWVACVSGTATSGSTNSAYAIANCSPCNSELASFTQTDCSAYAN